MSARASAARPSVTPTASFPRPNANARESRAKTRPPCRFSNASPCSMSSNAKACRRTSRPSRLSFPKSELCPKPNALITATGARIVEGGGEAFYHRGDDFIRIPPRETFVSTSDYYCTVLHELGHWTAHPSRLGRDLQNRFGSEAYAREELIAELTSAFLCAHLGIVPQVRHADYLGQLAANPQIRQPRDLSRRQPGQQGERFHSRLPPPRTTVRLTRTVAPMRAGLVARFSRRKCHGIENYPHRTIANLETQHALRPEEPGRVRHSAERAREGHPAAA